MAHHKRKRPRAHQRRGGSANYYNRRLGEGHDYCWYTNYPRAWDKVFHTRPARARTRQLETLVLKGHDPDNMTWPVYRRPHRYYW